MALTKRQANVSNMLQFIDCNIEDRNESNLNMEPSLNECSNFHLSSFATR